MNPNNFPKCDYRTGYWCSSPVMVLFMSHKTPVTVNMNRLTASWPPPLS